MAFIRRKDMKRVGLRNLDNPSSSALLVKIKHGKNKIVRKKVPVFSFRGKKL